MFSFFWVADAVHCKQNVSDETEPTTDPAPVVLNFGGEGEVAGAINVNDMTAVRRGASFPSPDDKVIEADFRNVPLPDDSANKIVGNRLPWFSTEEWAGAVCKEAFRLLKSGGIVQFHATTGGGDACVTWLERAGFQNVRIVGRHAEGIKP